MTHVYDSNNMWGNLIPYEADTRHAYAGLLSSITRGTSVALPFNKGTHFNGSTLPLTTH